MNSSKRFLSAIVVAAASLTAVAGAQAQSAVDGPYSFYSPGSAYVGLNAGKSDFSVGNGTGFFTSDNKDTTYGIYGGTYFTPYFGAELGYTNFGKINRAGGQTKAEGINASLIGRLPLSPQFNLLGKLGTTYGRTDVSSAFGSGVVPGKETGFDVSYGIGAEYAFTSAISGVVQYDEHKMKFAGGNNDRVGAATAGVRFKF